ncbi:MAG: YjfB family protein [Sulfuricella sp.]|nr:YjfB family protein [Sulfuricella sp.]
MDIGSIASLATNMAQERTQQEVSMAVLKKALDTEASNAMALIDAIPPAQSNLPANLGQNINVTA